jgi:hypothetical protein
MASELTPLRAEYKALAGRNPSPRLDADGLRAKIAELQANPNPNPPADDAAAAAAAKEAKGPKLVKMKRDPEQFPAPHSADVHPAEVDNYRAGGFEVA